MSDLDPVADLHDRLAQIEADLTYVRTGKAPPRPLDLLAWRVNGKAQRTASWLRTLRENWEGLSDAIRNWAIRFEARLGR